MLYPFYGVRAEVLLEMTTIEPHEDLKASALPYVPEVTEAKDPTYCRLLRCPLLRF